MSSFSEVSNSSKYQNFKLPKKVFAENQSPRASFKLGAQLVSVQNHLGNWKSWPYAYVNATWLNPFCMLLPQFAVVFVL